MSNTNEEQLWQALLYRSIADYKEAKNEEEREEILDFIDSDDFTYICDLANMDESKTRESFYKIIRGE